MENKINRFPITWEQAHRDALHLAQKLKNRNFDAIVAVCRGGLVPAALIARELGIHLIDTICFENSGQSETVIKDTVIESKNILILDDIINTGKTAKTIRQKFPHAHYASLYAKEEVKDLVDSYVTVVSQDTWFVFPWEHE